jgi:hypothetical protein
MRHLVYLHGFLSSPKSVKAQQTLAFAKRHFPSVNVHIPKLPGDINKAVKLIDSLVANLPMRDTCLIGSSMGGFLATYFLEKYTQNKVGELGRSDAPKAVLVNPAVVPFDLLNAYLGKHTNPYTNEVFYITTAHVNYLRQLFVPSLNDSKKYKVLLQTGDDILDYKLAVHKYKGADIVIEADGDHSFVNYDAHLPSIFQFLLSQQHT